MNTISNDVFSRGLESLLNPSAQIPANLSEALAKPSLGSDNEGEGAGKGAVEKTAQTGVKPEKKPRVTKPKGVDIDTLIEGGSVFGNWSKQKIVAHTKKAQIQRDAMLGAIKSRVTALIENQQFVAVEWALIEKNISRDESFVKCLAVLDGALDIKNLIDILPHHDKTKVEKTRYIQAKTVQKAVAMVRAFATRDLQSLDNYQQQVIYNALYNGNALSMRGCLASLSKNIECEGLSEEIKNRASYTSGTAGAQASQVRELCRVLGLGTTNKGSKEDTLIVNNERAERLREMFAM